MPHLQINEKISLFYEEYGTGDLSADNIILSAQVGFYPKGMQQHLATLGWHVFCITLRGFHPSTLVDEDYGEHWYDVFADDVVAFADKMVIESYTGEDADNDGLYAEGVEQAIAAVKKWFEANGLI